METHSVKTTTSWTVQLVFWNSEDRGDIRAVCNTYKYYSVEQMHQQWFWPGKASYSAGCRLLDTPWLHVVGWWGSLRCFALWLKNDDGVPALVAGCARRRRHFCCGSFRVSAEAYLSKPNCITHDMAPSAMLREDALPKSCAPWFPRLQCLA